MRRILLVIALLLVLVGAYFAWVFFGSATGFRGDVKYLYIPSDNPTPETVLNLIKRDTLVKHMRGFNFLAERMDYWRNIKPGKYKIAQGDNLVDIVRRLRNGQQEPVNLVIVKFRTREALAGAMARKLECDSADFLSFMNNADSLQPYGVDTNTVMTLIVPDTYTHFWNTTPKKVFNKFYEAYKSTWTEERKRKAAALNLTPASAYTLASIIEEETNDKNDKPLMASVYLNRISKGMRLGADPTVKFALRDFDIKRIYEKHTAVESPYNTYRVFGLPPGPICTPSLETLDAVLNAPTTDYLYFVAKSDFKGSHVFTTNYDDHLRYAREYQEAYDRRFGNK
ncbi:MAG TPA: endolytic transglycosylase MltG [Chitinophagaceae bacterium]|nr:endolytic transglycosylase MltG [Chitinophagaceae bacterium]